MEITKTQRAQAEERANTTQLELYSEPESGEKLWNIASKFNLTESKTYYVFTQLVGDIILGFYKVTDLSALIANKLQALNGMQQIAIEADLKMFLYPLAQANALHDDTEPNSLSSEIVATENEFATAATNHEVSGMGIRTMANDMQTAQSTTPTAPKYQPIYPTAPETIYTSNQADIFPTPQPAQNQDQKLPPRWDSERQ